MITSWNMLLLTNLILSYPLQLLLFDFKKRQLFFVFIAFISSFIFIHIMHFSQFIIFSKKKIDFSRKFDIINLFVVKDKRNNY